MTSFSLSVLMMLALALGEARHPVAGSRNDRPLAASIANVPACRGSVVSCRAASLVIKPAAEDEASHLLEYDKGTQIMDENDQPLPLATVKMGASVTVYYRSDDGRLTASRVVIHPSRRTSVVTQEQPAR
jgi:hypothetical protein